MSKAIVLLGDLGSDHEGFPPTPVIAGSPDVLIDGKPVARWGDWISGVNRSVGSGRLRRH